jgi:putative transposase
MWERYSRSPKYSHEQKKAAVEHYLEHGRNLSRTVRALGYPSREMLRSWCDELAPGTRKKRVGGLQYTREQKKEAVIALCTRTGSTKDIAKEFGVTREALYNWKNDLLQMEDCITMPREEDKPLPNDRDAFLSEIETLKSQIKRLKLEKAILEGTVEIVKKDPGVDPKSLTNKEKAILADALRNEYPLKELLGCLGMARSSYFYHRKIASLPDKYKELRRRIIELFEENGRRYGYRRIYALLVREETHVSEKVVRRIMLESNLVVAGRKKRKYSSYQCENTHPAGNLIERDSHANAPNVKWLTDITELRFSPGRYTFPLSWIVLMVY